MSPTPPLAPLRGVSIGLVFLLAIVPRVLAADGDFRPVEIAKSGLIGEKIALFVPAPLAPATLPHSHALLDKPVLQAGLPSDWRESPTFSTDGTKSRATVKIAAEVDLYGSGEVTGALRRNGTNIAIWNTDNYGYKKDNGRRLYQSHPWIMGLRPDGSAFGVIFDSTWKAELTCAEEITFTTEGPAFPVIVIDRSSPQAVLKALAELTGYMPLPPLWALGYQQCRYSYQPDARVREVADNFRTRKIPCDVIWMDIDYMEGYRVFTFRKDEFPDPAGLNRYLHERGFKTVWMIDPGIKIDPAYGVYTSGSKEDLWVKTASGAVFEGPVWPGPCVFPDFTMPKTRTWWAGLYRDFIATGIDGVWNDMNEPAVFDTPDWTMPEDNHHRGGGQLSPGPHRQYHNVYGMLMANATREGILAARPDKRPFVLTRASFLGGQRDAATWTGDNLSTDEHLRLSIPMTLTLGLSGQPFNGPDLGGFGEHATPELWARWVAVGAFFPFCRGHAVKGSNDKEPWAFGEKTEASARVALSRRYRLLPYLYTVFREAAKDGLPVMRPLFLTDPKDHRLRREEEAFTIGSDLLVVPRWAAKPSLPTTVWPEIALVSGEIEDVHQVSLRLRPGSILPLGRVTQSTAENALDPLTLLVSLDETGTAVGQLYEDAGDGFAYRQGDYLLTTYRATRNGDKVEVAISSSEGKRPRPSRRVQIEWVDAKGQRKGDLVSGL